MKALLGHSPGKDVTLLHYSQPSPGELSRHMQTIEDRILAWGVLNQADTDAGLYVMTSAGVTPDDDRKRSAREEIARRNREAWQPMTSPPLSPMLVQYLVGLCCLRWDPDAVDVTIGDMVYDASAEKERDVDVTVTVSEGGAPSYAFKGI